MQPQSIPPRWHCAEAAGVALLAWVVFITASLHAGGILQSRADQLKAGAIPIGESVSSLGGWTESPAHVRLFAPQAHQSEYRAFVSDSALDEVLRRIRGAQPGPPGAWRPESVSALDAFGGSGSYNRFQLVRLYLGTRPRTAYGPWSALAGLETWTLVSPYPNVALDAVEPGTLLLAMRVPPL
jgi:hypothetical protein